MPGTCSGSDIAAPVPGASIFLAPDFRFAGDDWSGANALGFVVYEVAPTYDASGNVLTSGIVRDLTGCSVVGSARYQTQCSAPQPAQPALFTLTGAIVDAVNGLVSLSLLAAQTVFPRQDPRLWNGGVPDPRRAALLVQPSIVGTDKCLVTIGLQPLFVF